MIIEKKEMVKIRSHYPELSSSILTLWVDPVPYHFILEAPPTGFFAGVYIIANHKTAVVLDCLRHRHAARKYFNNCEKRGTSACFRGKLKNPPSPTYISSTNKKIRDRVDSRVQLVWRLRVIGSCQNLILQGCFLHQSQNNSGM